MFNEFGHILICIFHLNSMFADNVSEEEVTFFSPIWVTDRTPHTREFNKRIHGEC